ncbi:glycoside hydrolase family 3 protein [Lacticaseibacillus mingshuiensis]|uniref:glycoside hydrolase family 3 protein n=1 Tax=Lacticaseibacillus mingshuiensis TaxID=2799574 RepID=UPI001951F6D7|nr:glycoside hydrolase family 3 protein [Lacticaseibacillus mingshuiensis]
MKKWTRLKYHPNTTLGPNGTRITSSTTHADLARRLAREGMVLLKNDDNALPLTDGVKLAVFGTNQFDYVKGGGGSADVVAPYAHGLNDGLAEKEAAGQLSVFAPLSDFYRESVQTQRAANIEVGRTTQPALDPALIEAAARFTDTAIITIGRFSGEGNDRQLKPGDGDYYLAPEEDAMVAAATVNFAHVIVVLNVGGVVDTNWFKDDPRIQAVLLAWQGGEEGGPAAADLLVGDTTPSGKLPDTFAGRDDAYPGAAHFTDSLDYVDYTEDIFVGYRYFETFAAARKQVNYPFGFGLSYTHFAISGVSVAPQAVTTVTTVSKAGGTDGQVEASDGFQVTATVLNTGDRAGKETLQLYLSAPQGQLGKPAKELVAFQKTRLLQPGEAQTVFLRFNLDDHASFDDLGKIAKSAFVLERGDYALSLGTSVADVETLDWHHREPADRIVRQAASLVTPHQLANRLLADGSYEALPTDDVQKTAVNDGSARVPLDATLPLTQVRRLTPQPVDRPEDWNDPSVAGLNLLDVAEGRGSLADLVGEMTNGELATLVSGIHVQQSVSNTGGFGGLPQHGIPEVMTADGPGGIRVERNIGQSATAWPCETLLASTFEPALLQEFGAAMASEMKENNLEVWLAPTLNIHRDPRCGRNFEYFSEDPLLNGLCGAAEITGIQNQHIGATIKHFACNNKEENRGESDSRVSERALREIYLRPFEIAVHLAQPWAVMTSYNMLNENFNAQNGEMLNDVLRGEWGFDGLVMTDWWNRAFHAKEIAAGNDLKMPDGEAGNLIEALASGDLTREQLETAARHVLELMLKLD